MLADNIKPYLPQIISRELTNREVAALLGTHETYVCRVLKRLGVKREAAASAAVSTQAKLRAARMEHRAAAAATLSVKDAARAANCSTRTIYRIRGKK